MDFHSFENREWRLLAILEGSQVVSETYLKDLFSVSLKTINNDVKLLNNLFKNIAFIRHDKDEYSLFIMDLEKYIDKKMELSESYRDFNQVKIRLAYIFTKLSNNKYYTMEDLADEMSISKTTLNTDIAKLKNILKPYNLKIKSKTNKGIWLDGEESGIRFCIMENIYRYAYEENIFNFEDDKKIKEILQKYNIESSIMKRLIRFLTVSLDRHELGYVVEMKDYKEDILESYYVPIIDEICLYIENQYSIHLPEEEKSFISICFITANIEMNIRKLENNLDSYNEYTELMKNILEDIEDVFGLTIDVSMISKDFMYHLFFMIKRTQYGIRYKNDMKENIKEKYVISYKMATIASKTIEDKYSYIICDDEIAFLAIHFELFVNNMSKNKALDVLLISDMNDSYKKLMMQEIKKSQSGNINTRSINVSEIDEGINNYDVIISTVRKDFDTSVPIIYQDDVIDIEYVCRRIEALRILGKDIVLVRGLDSILVSSITRDTFYKGNSLKTYSENVEIMLKELENKGLVDRDYILDINEKVMNSASLFTKKVAVPHSINKRSDEIIVSIGILSRGTSDYPDLRVIVMLGLPRERDNSNLLVRLYEELTMIIRNEKFIEEISRVEDYNMMIDYFIQNSNYLM